MLKHIVTRGSVGIEHGALVAAKHSNIQIYHHTDKNDLNILEKNWINSTATFLFDVNNKLDSFERLGVHSRRLSNQNHPIIIVTTFNPKYIEYYYDMVDYWSQNKKNIYLNIHGHRGHALESYNFFMEVYKIFEKE